MKAWVGVLPDGENPLKAGVVDSGGSSIIGREMISDEYTIRESPLHPIFDGIDDSQIPVLDYIILPIYLPNMIALSGDERSG
jgi:hypothetical protein